MQSRGVDGKCCMEHAEKQVKAGAAPLPRKEMDAQYEIKTMMTSSAWAQYARRQVDRQTCSSSWTDRCVRSAAAWHPLSCRRHHRGLRRACATCIEQAPPLLPAPFTVFSMPKCPFTNLEFTWSVSRCTGYAVSPLLTNAAELATDTKISNHSMSFTPTCSYS